MGGPADSDGANVDPRVRDFLTAFAPPPGKRLWYGGASLFGSLRGVDAAQAGWRAPGHEHSLWQLVLHCAYSRYNVRRLFEGSTARGGFPRTGGYWPPVRQQEAETAWRADLALLREEQRRLVAVVERFDAGRLDEHATRRWRYIDLLWGIVMHDMYHVGEMQVLKRLYQLHVAAEAGAGG